ICERRHREASGRVWEPNRMTVLPYPQNMTRAHRNYKLSVFLIPSGWLFRGHMKYHASAQVSLSGARAQSPSPPHLAAHLASAAADCSNNPDHTTCDGVDPSASGCATANAPNTVCSGFQQTINDTNGGN